MSATAFHSQAVGTAAAARYGQDRGALGDLAQGDRAGHQRRLIAQSLARDLPAGCFWCWLRIRPKLTHKPMQRSDRVTSGKVSLCGRQGHSFISLRT
jgi:hypothetical protein